MLFDIPCVQIIREFCNATVADRYGVSMGPSQLEILWSIIVSVFLVGGVTGSLSGGWVADRFGRYVGYRHYCIRQLSPVSIDSLNLQN
jgi:Sugar (and other) transporter.